MSTQYKATCKCGATVDVPYSDNFKDWLNSHKDCLKQQAMPRTWVDLTIEEVNTLWDEWKDAVCLDHKTWAKAIGAKLKDKNL